MPITTLEVPPLGPITQAFGLNFDPRVNVLIGPNAVGKSTIIRELARQHEQPPLMDDYDSFEDGVEFGDGDFLPLISVPSSRLVFPMTSDVVEEYSFKQTLDAGYNILDSRQVFRTFQNFSDYIWPIVAEAGISYAEEEYYEKLVEDRKRVILGIAVNCASRNL